MNKTKMNLTIILLLMLITGFIIYYIYLKPENFETTTPNSVSNTVSNTVANTSQNTAPNIIPPFTCPNLAPTLPLAILSRYFGVGFNIYPVTSTTSSTTNTDYYLIEHIPISTNGVSGGMYSISSDGTFTIKLKNNDDPSQWWSMKELTDSADKSLYQVMIPNNLPNMALQYSNGSLSIRPYTSPGFEGQKWLKTYTLVTRGIPVLNNSPASMFTTEFDPYSTSSSINTSNLSDSNSKQVTDVISAVKSGIQQYLLKTNNSQLNGQLSSSSLGNKNMPLSVNLNLGSGRDSSDSTKGVSFFENVTGSTSDDDILSILDKYEAKSGNNNRSQTVYSSNDLQNQLNTTANGCKLINLNDYTSNRVSTCNCKL
jgi:hypothetical protein